MAPGTLEAGPDVGLDVFQHVAQVDRPVGVGQGAGDQDLSFLLRHGYPFRIRRRDPRGRRGVYWRIANYLMTTVPDRERKKIQ